VCRGPRARAADFDYAAEDDRVERKTPPEPVGSDDEIEILEVVGLDERVRPAARPASPAEVVLDLGPEAAREPSPVEPDLRERLLRLGADFDNYRRRVDREREAHERQATASLIGRLLPVLDNFERALARDPGQGRDRMFDGVALIFRQLLEELRQEGLVAVDSVGEPFDPELHEAVATTVEPSLPPNIVVEELQRGYRLHSRLLRPALVRVTVAPSDAR
jgi:molecular chaperone GrpE